MNVMNVMKNKTQTTVLLALALSLSACSTAPTKIAENEWSPTSPDISREIASDEGCVKIMRSILSIDPRSGKLVEKDIERTFTTESASSTAFRQEQLDAHATRYRNVDSLLDYQSKAQIPIKDYVKIVDRAEDGLLAKIMMIRRAKTSIDLTYFLFDKSLAPQALLHELRLAAKRGVKIRILYDPVGSKMGTATPREGIPEDLQALADLKELRRAN